jgi:glycosyltransferase involved in cell wall biosynthesis
VIDGVVGSDVRMRQAEITRSRQTADCRSLSTFGRRTLEAFVMKISVVTVSYNSEKTIRETIESVLSQNHPDIEYLIVDGGSTDATVSIVREYGNKISRWLSEPDEGIYDAMNKGIGLATGDAVGFLNSDDVFADANAVATIAQGFESGDDAVYGDLVFTDSSGSRQVRFWQSEPYVPGSAPKGWAPPHPTLYIRREILLACHGFKKTYRYTADFELALRLFEVERIRTRYLPSTLVHMRLGGATTGSIKGIWCANWEAAKACRENGYPGGVWLIVRKLARKIPQLFRRRAPPTAPPL